MHKDSMFKSLTDKLSVSIALIKLIKLDSALTKITSITGLYLHLKTNWNKITSTLFRGLFLFKKRTKDSK